MQPKGWKNLSSWIFLLASIGTNCCNTRVDAAAQAKNPNLGSRKNDSNFSITSLGVTDATDLTCQTQSKIKGTPTDSSSLGLTLITKPDLCESPQEKFSPLSSLNSLIDPNETQTSPGYQPNRSSPNTPVINQQANEAPTLEGNTTNNFPQASPRTPSIEQNLQVRLKNDYTERLNSLLHKLEENKKLSNGNSEPELGRLVVKQRQLEQLPPPPTKPVMVEPKPNGFLTAHFGLFHSTNIFSSVVPKEDSLIFSGLSLAFAPLALNPKTFVSGSIDGNLVYYMNQSKYNYSQIKFNVDIYRQLTPRMYGDFGWSNQQLFYARDGSFYKAGQRFLGENSLRLSLGRRDPLSSKLVLDSLYELRLSFTDPPGGKDNRNRVINTFWLSLNYFLQKSLQAGADYLFSLSDFTEQTREDQYHQIFGHLT
ncbi:hypothetical protein, partial [Aetokthonos hydrillicola]